MLYELEESHSQFWADCILQVLVKQLKILSNMIWQEEDL